MPSVTIIPNGYTSNVGSYNFTIDTSNASRRISNAYHNADNTSSSARLTLASNRNSARTSVMYLEFDKSALDNIPSSATIGTITANVRYYVNNTTYCSALSIQLHANTTVKGSAVTTRTTSSAKYSITPGSWTLAELKTARLYISATHNKSTSSAYLYLYGADVTVNYTLPPAYNITASSSASGVTIEPASQSVYQGQSASVTLNKNTNIIVTDNNVDVTSQLVATPLSGTIDVIPNACVESTFATDSSYPTSNGLHGTTDTNNYARFKLTSTTQHAIYSFNTSAIPSGATILSVACNVKGYISSTSSSITTKSARLYAGNTAKGSATTIPTTNSTWAIADPGSNWTYSEIQNVRVRFDGYYANTQNYYFYFYGADLTVTYESDQMVYVYTISNVQAAHTILVVRGSGPSYTIYVKDNGVWKQGTVYVKQNGSWVEASDVLVKNGGSWH